MALGLQEYKVTQDVFLKELYRFDSIKLDQQAAGHFVFVCWDEGVCSFYEITDIDDADELRDFAAVAEKLHESELRDRVCENCGSSRTTRSEHTSKAFDDREVKGELRQVEIIECYVVYKCECGHKRVISF